MTEEQLNNAKKGIQYLLKAYKNAISEKGELMVENVYLKLKILQLQGIKIDDEDIVKFIEEGDDIYWRKEKC